MPPPADPVLEDDASGEAWFQKGVTLLEGRKQERETEEQLRKAMGRSIMGQWHFWLAVLFGMGALLLRPAGIAWWSMAVPLAVSGLFSFVNALDQAAAKRTEAILEWIKYQREKDRVKDHS